MNNTQKMKRDFRKSKIWKALRHKKNVEQNGIDPITKKKLLKYCNLHHLDLDEKNYTHLDNEDNFVLLNKQTHECLHFLYRYYCKDKDILERFRYYLDLMCEINGDN